MSRKPRWKMFYRKGIKRFRSQEIDEALQSFDQAISLAKDKSYVLYDSRASAYEKKDCLEDALCDAKKTIDIAPKQWHGYFRSARVFAALGQTDAALRMSSLALERLSDAPRHKARRRELLILRRHLDPRTEGPLSRIPVELLLTIFKLSNNPDVVSHVCRRWREFALSQSTLWQSLVLVAPAETAILKIREWHKRSHGRIVKLSIRDSLATDIFPFTHYLSFDPDGEVYTELLDTLSHLDWTKLKECHTEGVKAEPFLFELSGGEGFQHIEVLSASRGTRQCSTNITFEHTKHWENLRVFNITDVWCNWMALSTSMCHLTSLEYRVGDCDHSFGRFHQFLQANPGLERLVIKAGDNDPEEAPGSLTLVHLRHLELGGVFPFDVKSGNFSLPSLQILRMTVLHNATSILSELVRDKGTSFAELVELTARDSELEPRDLAPVLLRTPKLETLNISEDAVNDVAESLTKPCMALLRDPASKDPKLVPTALPILCPALSMLNLSRSPDLKTDPVMRIVKERIALATSQDGGRYQLPGDDGDRKVSCIRTLNVDECSHFKATTVPSWFRENVPQFSCHYEFGY